MFSKLFTVSVVICLQSCFQGCEYLLLIWLDVLPRLRSVTWHLCMLKHILFKWASASRYSRQLIILSLFTSVALKKFFSSVIVKYRLFCSEFSVWDKTEAILTSSVQKISAECRGIRLMIFWKCQLLTDWMRPTKDVTGISNCRLPFLHDCWSNDF